jgi:hypothetical protein
MVASAASVLPELPELLEVSMAFGLISEFAFDAEA